VLNIPPLSVRFSYCNTKHHIKIAVVWEEVCQKGVLHATEEASNSKNDIKTDLCMSCGNTWMKHGYSSLYHMSSVISVDTGQVLDV
jgi:hypothetical protein